MDKCALEWFHSYVGKLRRKRIMTADIRLAVDIGGTFTDLVAIETGPEGMKITTAKSDTTPPNFEAGVLNVMAKGNIDPKDVDFMVHGTTVVIASHDPLPQRDWPGRRLTLEEGRLAQV